MTKCEICKRKAVGIIRTKDVCRYCFNWIKRDNFKRVNTEEIPNNLKVFKKCFKCNKTFEEVPKYAFKELGIVPEEPTCVKCRS